MRTSLLILITIASFLLAWNAQAQSYEEEGAWAPYEYAKGAILIFSLGGYGESSDTGVIPTFMVNYGSDNSCLISFGLAVSKDNLSPRNNNFRETLDMLASVIKRSDFFADDELLTRPLNEVQAVDMGEFLYARTLLDSNSVVAFMQAITGSIRLKDEDAGFVFDMQGFNEIISKIINGHCA